MLIRTERHIIDKNNVNYKNCIEICHLSKNLYNYVNYILRQSFLTTKNLPSENEINTLLAKDNQQDFRALPSNVSQQTVKLVFKAWRSFFMALKSYKKINLNSKTTLRYLNIRVKMDYTFVHLHI